MSRILVTGGTGFVGQRVVRDLIASGHEVRLLSRSNVAIEGVDVRVVADIRDEEATRGAMAGMDGICHLAGRAHILGAPPADHEAMFEEINVAWTSRLAEAAFGCGVKRFVFVSSIGAVGVASEPNSPWSEETECRPVTPYGRSKLSAEQNLRVIAGRHGAEWVAVRPPLVYGKGAPGNMARMARWVAKGLPLPLAGIENSRSLIHVDNLSQILVASLEHPAAAGHIFHVRDAQDYSTPQILRNVARSIGRPARLYRVPAGLLKLLAAAVGQQRSLEQLTGWLQVDDTLVRKLLDIKPVERPFEVV